MAQGTDSSTDCWKDTYFLMSGYYSHSIKTRWLALLLEIYNETYNHSSFVTFYIKEQDTRMRKMMLPQERLSATLRFLETGRSYKDMDFTAIISMQVITEIIQDTCEAPISFLKKFTWR